ncbi:MAG TPA: hypothetical protein VLT58_01275 [Polyangia bacterium]|nr:hypothetical protein [Polyangia bacterium]
MGVMLDDVVRALFPEHGQPGHAVTILPQKKLYAGHPIEWACSCGHRDVLLNDENGGEIGRALREGLVTPT